MRYYAQPNRNRFAIGQDGNALTMLIAINLVVFVMLALLQIVYFFSFNRIEGNALFTEQVMRWISLPAEGGELLRKPWTIITYMFVHTGVWHILGNLLWLWGFGHLLQDLAGNRQVVPIYVYGGLAGALVFLLSYNFIPGLRPELEGTNLIGASAGVMAIAIGTTVLAPGYRIFPMLNGGIPLWVLTTLFVIIDLATIPQGNTGGHLAHLAGAAAGAIYVVQLRKGRDGGKWMNDFFDWTGNLFNPDRPRKGRSIKQQLFYKSGTQPFRKTPHLTQQRVDEILDKIGQKGYGALTEEEKDLLKRASKDL